MQVIAYQAINKVNGHRYIGVTKCGLKTRERAHRYAAKRGKGFVLHAAIRKHGQENFVFETVAEFGDDYQLAMIFEQEAIAKWKPEYNSSMGGEGRTGPMSEAHKAALSQANKGQGLGRKGRPLNEAQKQRLREINLGNKNMLGRKHSDETKAKISAAHKGVPRPERRGVPRSPETIAKISAAQKGRPSIWKGVKRDYGPKVSAALKGRPQERTSARIQAQKANLAKGAAALKKPVVCVTDGKIYPSAVDAAKAYGLRLQAVGQSIRRNQTTRQGLKFIRLENP